jgi:hypothetical protein
MSGPRRRRWASNYRALAPFAAASHSAVVRSSPFATRGMAEMLDALDRGKGPQVVRFERVAGLIETLLLLIDDDRDLYAPGSQGAARETCRRPNDTGCGDGLTAPAQIVHRAHFQQIAQNLEQKLRLGVSLPGGFDDLPASVRFGLIPVSRQ